MEVVEPLADEEAGADGAVKAWPPGVPVHLNLQVDVHGQGGPGEPLAEQALGDPDTAHQQPVGAVTLEDQELKLRRVGRRVEGKQ